MTDKHGDRELKIFARFARAANLCVMPDTVERRLPPEPDLLCLIGGERVAFELVEIIDSDFAARVYGHLRLKSLFERMADLDRWRGRLSAALGNALVHVTFQEVDFLAKRDAVPLVLDHLASLDPLFVGELHPPALASTVRLIRVTRLSATGPFFDVDTAGSLGDPTAERVGAKCEKCYETPWAIELLAYYELQPALPEQLWQPGLEAVLVARWHSCSFRRAWVYDCGADVVRFAQARPTTKLRSLTRRCT